MHLRLYIASRTPNSIAAEATLRAVMAEDHDSAFAFEVIDVMERPDLAFSDGVLVTPTLIRIEGDERRVLVGRLEPPELVEQFVFRTRS